MSISVSSGQCHSGPGQRGQACALQVSGKTDRHQHGDLWGSDYSDTWHFREPQYMTSSGLGLTSASERLLGS